MKKKSCLMLAFLIVMIHVITVFAVMPATAASLGRSYDLYPATSEIALDGSDSDWEAFPWSEKFEKATDSAGTHATTVTANFKAAWKESATAGSIDLYFLIKITGDSTVAGVDTFRINTKVGDKAVETGSKARTATALTTVSDAVQYIVTVAADKTTHIEVRMTVDKPAANNFAFDIKVQDGTWSYNDYVRYSWNGGTWYESTGVGVLKTEVYEEKICEISKAASDITVDANAAEWANIPKSQYFVYANTNDTAGTTAKFNPSVRASTKIMWKESATAGKVDVYFLTEISGYNAGATSKLFQYRAKSNGTELVTNAIGVANTANTSKVNGALNFNYAVAVENNSKAVVEVCLTFDKPADNSLLVDICYLEYNGGYTYFMAYTLDGDAHNVISEKAILKDSTDVFNPLAGVSVTATNGASIRLDTADASKSGIRFATTVSAPAGVTVKKTGTLVLPTAKLTDKKMMDVSLTKEGLESAGYVEGKDYYDIVNVGNQWVEGQDGTWYGTLIDIKEANYGRAISGVGYAVVEVNGVEYTVYADYVSAQHSRSIRTVAQALLDQGTYAEGTTEYALLKTFTATEAN